MGTEGERFALFTLGGYLAPTCISGSSSACAVQWPIVLQVAV